MNLGLSETQELLKRSAREFLADASPPSLVRALLGDEQGYSPDLWRGMIDLGWTGLLIPEQYGGGGGTVLDACILFEEIGRAIAPAPLFSSSVLGALTILHAGNEAQKQALLPAIAAGSKVPVLAFTELSGSWAPSGIETTATREGDSYVLRGTKVLIPDAHLADPLIVVAREGNTTGKDGILALLVDSGSEGVRLRKLPTIGGDPQFEVVLDGVRVPAGDVLGSPASGWEQLEAALAPATLVKCAEMTGGSQKALDMAVDYAKIRVAFGRPIGSFQIIQHKCANMVTKVDGLQMLVYEAAWRMDEGLPTRIEVSVTKDYANEVFRDVTVEAHQIFAGIGYTVDHDLHLYFRRVKAAEAALGDSRHHKKILAEALSL